ncbi:MAG: hypothetical protein A2202_00100 [Bdellovibrionales bacterium RIFOXYA1_FULL_36_14]|nr:MAG: hypothetical protein A2202_00100 [Bdellovibrionales bacterium RIFOXYA1_FULL_36_14]
MGKADTKTIKQPSKKIILNLAGIIADNLKKVFDSFNCVLVSEVATGANIDFILVRDVALGYEELASKYQTIKKNIPMISLKEVLNKDEFIKCNGRGWINERILLTDQFLETFDRFFNKTSSLHLEDIYSNLQYKSEVIKLTGHMNIGHYMDIISSEAMIKGHNVINIRKYFLNATTYLGYLRSADIGKYPIDIDYMIKNDRMDLQMYCSVENFYLEYVQSAMRNPDRLNPLKGALADCFYHTDFLDVYFLTKSAKVVLSATFLKDELLDKKEGYFTSMLLNEIDSFNQFQLKEKERLINIKIKKDEILEYGQLENETLPGEGIEVYTQKRLRDEPQLFEKVINHVDQVREQEENPKSEIELNHFDIQNYLKNYPSLEEIAFLGIDDYEDILGALINGIDFVLNEKQHYTIKGTDHIKDEFTRISGTKEPKEGMYIIKGSKQENEKGEMRFISPGANQGENDPLDQEDLVAEAGELFEQRIEQATQNYEKRIQALLRELEEAKLQVRNTAQDKAEIEKLSKENNDYLNALETAMKRIEILSDKLDKAQAGKPSPAVTNMNTVVPAGKNSENMSEADETLRRQYSKLKRECDERVLEVKRLEHLNRQLEMEVKRLTAQLEKSSETLDENKDEEAKVRGMEVELKNLKVEANNKEKTVQLLTQRVKVLTEQISRLQDDSKASRPVDNGKIAKIENRMKQVDIANQNLTKERDALKKEIADKKKDGVILQKENQSLRNQNQELERKLKVEKSKQAA